MWKITQEEFIDRANLIHKRKYNYSKLNYINSKTKIEIICPVHGSFLQLPWRHLEGKGCPLCGRIKQRESKLKSNEDFIKELETLYGDKYIYTKVKYQGSHKDILLICPTHGEFKRKADACLHGCGCPKCHYQKISQSLTYTTKDFIDKANKVHNNRYNYCETNYINSKAKLKILCPIHGAFYQNAALHLQGNGCPKCNESKGERIIRNWLEHHNIKYIAQYRFNDCRNKKPLPFDFYLPEYNTCIEFDGEQHYKTPKDWLPIDNSQIKVNDSIKTNYCKEYNIKLIRIPYNKIKHVFEILEEGINSE